MEFYDIYYKENNTDKIFDCSEVSLKLTLQRIKNAGGEIIDVKKRKNPKAKKSIRLEEVEKRKLYISYYNAGYSKWKRGKITEQEFKEYIEKAKEIKKISKTKKEFENGFINYKRELDKK